MHDPQTVAHEIYLGKKKRRNGSYRSPFITIWHVDPEKDGTDDSCGWFMRDRHIDKNLREKIRKEFAFEFKNHYWFNEAGYPKFSTSGVALDMFYKVVWNVFMWKDGGNPTKRARRRTDRFMRKHLWEILNFAENPTDSLCDAINMKYGVESVEYRVNHFSSIILAYVMRKLRPWYQHPRWHIHHWRIQFHPWLNIYRKYIQKCCKCGKTGFEGGRFGNWDGDKTWCGKCESLTYKPGPCPPLDQNLRNEI